MGFFKGNSANTVWKDAVRSFASGEEMHSQPSRNGPTKEILHAHFSISDPRQRWIWSRMPAINPAFAIAEFYWILAGSNDASFINKWFPDLANYSGGSETYHGAYGHRLRNTYNFDQLERAYQVLSENPDSRQVVLQIWNPNLDFPKSDGSSSAPDIPCNICSLPKVRNGKLEWLQIMRSNDVYRGMPYNVVQFTMLQETLAGWLGVEVGEYHQISDSLHVYEDDISKFGTDDQGDFGAQMDDISLHKDEHYRVFQESYKALTAIAKKARNPKSLVQTVSSLDLPQPYINLISIAAAEIARRESLFDAMDNAANQCSSEILIEMWHRWERRWRKN